MYYTIDTQYCALAKAKEGVRQAALQTVDTALDRQDTAELFRLMEESNELFDAVKMRLDRIMAFITAEEFDALLLRMSEKEQLLDRAENAKTPNLSGSDKRGRFPKGGGDLEPPATYAQYRGVFCLYPSWCKKLGYRGIRIRGSLVSCAVALNRPDLLSLLLQGGYSANPLVHTRLTCLWDKENIPSDLMNLREDSLFDVIRNSCGGFPNGASYAKTIWKRELSGMSLSPLSLAILLGRTECVRALLDHGSGCCF
ncbi:MAG: hypothetical protein IKL23_00555, partial [Oscillospiraceae bacterium]|nr:hypothetical protein [Oscillospiraceae bacterium]